ncbi:NHLP family bacteriocin export ABC transporter peptidase/permease/ATPase subunit [Selenomonas sp. AB3002]|uniref:NHLP family bacteriocin export ABC transporter peptidase/permease/ATPase subunit n=1 Tax=Selenomonas sp. AB3002 TaxID=1392502 RepID=UPI00068FD537
MGINFFQNKYRTKVPTVLQMEATECGAASLAMVLAHYGKWLPLEKLRQDCGVTRDGSNAQNILRAAKNHGCTAKGFAGRPNVLRKKEYPLILFWEFNHFVVLEGIKGDTVYLNDPAMGRRTVAWEEFVGSYTGVYLAIRPGQGFKKEGHRYSVVQAIAGRLREDNWAVLFVSLLGLAMILPGLAVPVLNQIFLDDIFSLKHVDWVNKFIGAMVITMVLLGIMTTMRSMVLTYWQKKLTLADSSGFFWHVLRLPVAFFQQRFAADVASRIQYNEMNAEVLSNQAATSLLDMLVAVFYLGLLFQYSVPLTLIGVSVSLVNVGVFLYMRRRLTDLTMRMQQDTGKAYGVLMSGIMMIESIKANGSESDLFNKWAGYRAKVLMATQERDMWSLKVKLLPSILVGVNSAIIMTVGGFSIMEGVMTAGIYTAVNTLLAKFQEPMQKLLTFGATLQNTEMQMQRLDDVRRYQIDQLNYPDEGQQITFKGTRLSGELTLQDVSFGYSPLDPPLLEHFNLHLLPGRWAAVVGSSGSGKSTLAKLTAGLYEEWSGQVRFDGVPRREIPRAVIVNSISTVDQDIFQIEGTIRENISLFDSGLPKADIIQAARDACIEEDILRLQGGYEAKVSEGGLNFSGGQRQRMEIARALATNPSLLILDEATSAIDPMTEQKILENIRRRGCSCLIVAHRLSTIRDTDEIIVLEHGKVAERGTHRELMQHEGAYRRLIEEREQEDTGEPTLD